MQPGLVVVTLDEREHLGLPVGHVAPGRRRRALELQRGEEALRHGIVPAIAFAAHALEGAGLFEQLGGALVVSSSTERSCCRSTSTRSRERSHTSWMLIGSRCRAAVQSPWTR